MAIIWDFNLVSPSFIDLCPFFSNKRENEKPIELISISAIDDWEWNNQRELDTFREIEKNLEEGKIIIISLKSSLWESLGMYIEKVDRYIYTLWINTEGVPELDLDEVCNKNIHYYDRAYHFLKKMMEQYHFKFDAIAIGLEGKLCYNDDIYQMVNDSENIVAWIMDKKKVCSLKSYRKRVIDCLDAVVFEH